MSKIIGEGKFKYEALDNWEKLPNGVQLVESPGVAVNENDDVFVLTRNTQHPIMVFAKDGSFLRSFGEGVFSARAHGLSIAPNGTLLGVDDGMHSITQWTQKGDLLHTLGGTASIKWSGKPFNRPTHAAISPKSGDVYITDGYGNAKVHRFAITGEHILSWGSPGIDPGQFIRPHNVVIDNDEQIYIADRECHRIQIFSPEGQLINIWNNIHRPDGITLGPDGNMYIGELNGMDGMEGCPGLGHRISIYDKQGKLLARIGGENEGEEPGNFIAPHGIAVDSKGDIYIGEVSFSIRGRLLDPPRILKSLKKLVRLG